MKALWVAILVVFAFTACQDKSKQVEFMFRKFLEKENPSVEKLLADKELANWNAHAYGSDSAYHEYMNALNDLYERTGNETAEEIFEHYEGLFYDYIQNDRKLDFISKIRESEMIKDPVLRQQLEFYYFLYLEGHVYPELQKIHEMSSVMLEDYKKIVRGCKSASPKTDSILTALNVTDKYQKEWMACHLPGEPLAKKIVERAKMENEIARKLGYKNYHQYFIESQQVDYQKLVEFFDSLELATREPYREFVDKRKQVSAKKYNIPVSKVRPWHSSMSKDEKMFYGKTITSKIEEKGLLNIMRSYFYSIGLPIDDIIANSDFEEREGKYPNALMFRISKNDVRVLGREYNHFYGLREGLHMFGHAVYETGVDEALPLIITSPNAALHEAVAMMFEHLAYNPDWLEYNLGIPKDSTLKYINADFSRELELKLCRVILSVFNFEKALYENPDADLNSTWNQLFAKMRMVEYPEDYDVADWAVIPHIVNEGSTFFSYQIGLVFLWQLKNQMHQEITNLPQSFSNDMRIGTFLKENLFYMGNSNAMDSIIKYASGQELSSKAYLQMIGH